MLTLWRRAVKSRQVVGIVKEVAGISGPSMR